MRSPGKFVFSRREPDLPRESASTPKTDAAALFEPSDIAIESSILEGVSLAGRAFSSILWKDVRLIRCDLANLSTRGLTLLRVEFVDCRMTGFQAGVADCRDILFSAGDQRYCQFRYSRFKSAEFDTCNFAEADFQGSDLSGSVFRKCNLQGAEMSKARLVNADLRGSEVEGLQLNAEDIRGAVVDPSQAMIFASLLGIRIE